MTEFKKDVRFRAGYDRLNETPNYGIDGGSFVFTLSGPLGDIWFSFSPSLFPQSAVDHLVKCNHNVGTEVARSLRPHSRTVGWHSPTPQYEDQEVYHEKCEHFDGKPCYQDAGYCIADDWMKEFLVKGTDWLWPKLEEEYHTTYINK